MPVIGVIEPGARAAAAAADGGPIGVIGTAGTIASNAYARAIQRSRPRPRVEQRALPAVRAAGGGGLVRPPGRRADRARSTSSRCAARGWTRWCSGCTHYPLLKPLLQRVMGAGRAADRQRRGDGGAPWRRCSRERRSTAPGRRDRRRIASP